MSDDGAKNTQLMETIKGAVNLSEFAYRSRKRPEVGGKGGQMGRVQHSPLSREINGKCAFDSGNEKAREITL